MIQRSKQAKKRRKEEEEEKKPRLKKLYLRHVVVPEREHEPARQEKWLDLGWAHGQNTTKNEIPFSSPRLFSRGWLAKLGNTRDAPRILLFPSSPVPPFIAARIHRAANDTWKQSVLVAADNGSKLPPREGKPRRGKEKEISIVVKGQSKLLLWSTRGREGWMGWARVDRFIAAFLHEKVYGEYLSSFKYRGMVW